MLLVFSRTNSLIDTDGLHVPKRGNSWYPKRDALGYNAYNTVLGASICIDLRIKNMNGSLLWRVFGSRGSIGSAYSRE